MAFYNEVLVTITESEYPITQIETHKKYGDSWLGKIQQPLLLSYKVRFFTHSKDNFITSFTAYYGYCSLGTYSLE